MTIRLLKVGGALLGTMLVASPAAAADLALKRVMLSTGGVGYFEYAADVDGAATLGLDVPLEQVDDVLMSLVVFDSAGGVGGIELPGESGSNAAFGDVPFGPDAMNSALAYLNGLQGVEITVQGPRPMTGRLLQVEQVNEPGKTPDSTPGNTIVRTRASVLTEAGLQQFVLEDSDAVQVSDPDLRGRIRRALETLRHSSAHDVRHLTIRSTGSGPRTVTVGYVAGAPLWKTSYRLVLPQGTGDKARLQGWAVLENQSAADWNGVALTLQSGNPVTFRQAIYRSYYVQRPEVPVEVFGRILPGVDTAARPMAKSEARALQAPAASAPAPMAMPAPAPAGQALAPPAEETQATEGAEQTSFTLPTPVVLAAGHTASVPILDREVKAARIDLALAAQPHPTAALRLTNDSGSSLPPGVLTLYETAPALAFAGDARLGGLPVGQNRLLSFAEDLRTDVAWKTSNQQSLVSLTAAGGVVRYHERQRRLYDVSVTAPVDEARDVLVEIPKSISIGAKPDETMAPLDAPDATEETARGWRFLVALRPGETRQLKVAVDRGGPSELVLTQNVGVIGRFLGEDGLSDTARAALRHLADLRTAEAAAITARDQVRARRLAVEADEDRLRKNLAAVTPTDALHGRLVRQLDADETQIASLDAAAAGADGAVEQAQKALQDAILTLKI